MTSSFCALTGPQGGDNFDVTDVADNFASMVNILANLPLDECMLGQQVTGFIGNHIAAGTSQVRVRNTNTQRVKMLEVLDPITEEEWRPLEFPFVVEKDDVLECFHVVTPT